MMCENMAEEKDSLPWFLQRRLCINLNFKRFLGPKPQMGLDGSICRMQLRMHKSLCHEGDEGETD